MFQSFSHFHSHSHSDISHIAFDVVLCFTVFPFFTVFNLKVEYHCAALDFRFNGGNRFYYGQKAENEIFNGKTGLAGRRRHGQRKWLLFLFFSAGRQIEE